MRFLISLFLVLMLTTSAFAMDRELKDVAHRYTETVVLYYDADFIPDFCPNFTVQSCGALYSIDGDGYWLTLDFPEANYISVAGRDAQVVKSEGGCTLLRTRDYAPFGTVSNSFYVGRDQDYFFSSIADYDTVGKLHSDWYDSYSIHCNLTPESETYGAPVFDMNGNMVGLVAGPDWFSVGCTCCGYKCIEHGTRVIRIKPEMF